MPEGLSPAEVSKEIAEHRERAAHEAQAKPEHGAGDHHDRWLSIAEAVLLP